MKPFATAAYDLPSLLAGVPRPAAKPRPPRVLARAVMAAVAFLPGLITAGTLTMASWLAIAIFAGTAFWAAPRAALAQSTLTWDFNNNQTTDGSGNWDLADPFWYNGSTDQAWAYGDTAAFGYSGGTGGTVILTTGLTAAGITLNSDTGGFTFGGTGNPTLTLGSGGITIAAGNPAETFNNTMAIALSASQSWTNNSTAGTLTVNSGITAGAGSGTQTLTIAGAGNTTIGGVIGNGNIGGTMALTMSGSGTLTLMADNTYTGLTTVNSGVLVLAQTNADIAANSAGLVVNSGGTVRVNATNALAAGATGVPVTINGGGLLETGSGAAINSWINALTLSGGTLSSLGTANTVWGNWQMGGTVSVAAGSGATSTIGAASVTLDQTGGVVFNVGSSGAASGIDLNVSGAIIHGTSARTTA